MFGKLWRWFWWGGGQPDTTPEVIHPGGVFRRRGDTARVFGRSGDTARVFRRRGDTARVFRGDVRMAESIQYDTRPLDSSETVKFVFDFSRFPEFANSETLGTPVIDASSPAGLTLGSPIVTTADEVVDAVGTTVVSGKGIKVTVSGGSPGTTYTLECRGTFTSGAVRVVKGHVVVE